MTDSFGAMTGTDRLRVRGSSKALDHPRRPLQSLNNGGFAAMQSAPADGRCHGEIGGDLSLRGSGVAVDVACSPWYARRSGENKATELPMRRLTGIGFRWA